MKKCKKCNGCCEYIQIEGILFLYCDFCNIYYHRQPGGLLVEVTNLEEYINKLRTLVWKVVKNEES